MKYLKSYTLLNESFHENVLNRNLINDAKDMALEYIDMGMYLHIDVFSDERTNPNNVSMNSVWIYEVVFDHNRDISNDYNEHRKIKNILYLIQLHSPTAYPSEKEKLYHNMTIELRERLKMAYPNEIIL